MRTGLAVASGWSRGTARWSGSSISGSSTILAGQLGERSASATIADVELARREAVDQLARDRLVEAQLHLGVRLVEGADRERDQRGVGGRRRADVQPAAPRAGESASSWLSAAVRRSRITSAWPDQQLAGRRSGARRARSARPGGVPASAFERGDLARDRGLGERERVGRGGEGAVRGDLAQDPQAANVKHVQSV
jgi:hypothetical protein